jgi:probable rRNA maturation factor
LFNTVLMPERVSVHVAAGLDLPLPESAISQAVAAVMNRQHVLDGDISITFLDDAEMARLNREHLSHDGPTDVISFPLSTPDNPIVGDVYVGLDRAIAQAAGLGIDPREEVLRLAVHGTLHVLGHEHPEDGTREDSEMYRIQEDLLLELMDSMRLE